jgi:hypothetical protein
MQHTTARLAQDDTKTGAYNPTHGHRYTMATEKDQPIMSDTPTSIGGDTPIYAPDAVLPANVMALCKTNLEVRIAKLIVVLGMGYHPDTPGGDYVGIGHDVNVVNTMKAMVPSTTLGDLEPLFSDEQAQAIDSDHELLFWFHRDPYEWGLSIWAAMGLLPTSALD